MSSDSDDVWASSDDDLAEYDRAIAQKEWDKLNINHGNEGYKEGIVEGKEMNMQKGFDKGYIEGLEIGKAIGRMRGQLNTYKIFYREIMNNADKARQLEELETKLAEVDVQHIFSKEYFDENSKPGSFVDPTTHIQQWQTQVDALISSIHVL